MTRRRAVLLALLMPVILPCVGVASMVWWARETITDLRKAFAHNEIQTEKKLRLVQ